MVAADWNGLIRSERKSPASAGLFCSSFPRRWASMGVPFSYFPENQKGEKQTPWIPVSAEMTSNGMA
jgi:hypothetical protein